jgi:hypothetical protein
MSRYPTVAIYRLSEADKARALRDKLQAEGNSVFLVRRDDEIRVLAAPLRNIVANKGT